MARNRYPDEDILSYCVEIELNVASGNDVLTTCRVAGVNDDTYYNWHKRFGYMGRFLRTGLKLWRKRTIGWRRSLLIMNRTTNPPEVP